MSYEHLDATVRDRIATVALDRPERRNALDPAMLGELLECLASLRGDEGVRAIVLTGSGDTFSAGGDVRELRRRLDSDPGYARLPETLTTRFVEGILAVEQPIVAAVNGHAVGVGCSVALWCDVVVAAEDALLGDPHVRAGLSVPQNVILYPLLVGVARAKRLLLFGELVDGSRAAEIGLVDRAVPARDVLATADRLARELAALPPLALRWTKRALNQRLRMEVAAHLGHSVALESLSMQTEDHRAALDAFLDKREATYRGR